MPEKSHLTWTSSLGQDPVPVPVEDYGYDAEGNQSASHLSLGHVHDAHNRLIEDDTYRYTYDASGNRLTREAKADGGTDRYGYDGFNRLTRLERADAAVFEYRYDPLNRRLLSIEKDIDLGGGTTADRAELFIYDGADIALVYDGEPGSGAWTLTERWFHGAQIDEPLAYEQHSGTSAPGEGTALELHADRLGSVVAVVDASLGTAVEETRYDSFGRILSRSGAPGQRYGFTGREYDAESGLYYYRARHYDPDTGRFLQSDPIGFAAGDLNTYAYTWNDPVNWTDPSGLAGTAVELPPTRAASAAAAAGAGRIFSAALQAAQRIAAALRAGAVLNQAAGDDDSGSSDEDGTDEDGDNCEPAPTPSTPANDGQCPPHGNPDHDQEIDRLADEARERGATNIRKNQTQVDINGNRVGNNRPDLQYDLDGTHHNVEVGRDQGVLDGRGDNILSNDPNSIFTDILL